MARVYAYWNDPAHAPHDSDEQWAHELERLWSSVEALAERIAREGGARTPLDPDGGY